ncbi:hypothetical protein BH11PLA1_BH11PLA1_08710 [soil metagenome]
MCALQHVTPPRLIQNGSLRHRHALLFGLTFHTDEHWQIRSLNHQSHHSDSFAIYSLGPNVLAVAQVNPPRILRTSQSAAAFAVLW